MSNLRTPHNPRIAAAALRFFEINEDRAELLRVEDEIRRGMVETFGFTEVQLPTAEESAARGDRIRTAKVKAYWRRKTGKEE
jgi:hypothetical protein